VWFVRGSGLITAYVLVALVGVAMSLLGSTLGRVYWQRRPGSRNLLFSELMVWGYVHRRYTERRLNSARAVLGALSNAHSTMDNGLSPERQAKLLEGFARALDARDPTTYGHSRRVARYSWMIATRMSLTREEVARIRTAAAIHDIGKIQTPDSVLNKRGPWR
jgi:HD-GYP domain-containing protein (c-di-GMP phosphodiesterase class II)